MVQGDVGTRVDAPPEKSETVHSYRTSFPLRAKFIVLGIAFALPLITLYLLDLFSSFRLFENVHVVFVLFLLYAFSLYGVVEFIYIRPLRKLLQWFESARVSSFEKVSTVPFQLSDELGQLARALGAAISHFWNAEKRIKMLLSQKEDTMTLIEHQLRTPLTAFLWSLENTKLPPEVENALLRIKTVVQAIIEAARIEEGKFGYVFTEIEPIALIENVLARFKQLAESKNIALTFEHGSESFKLKADEDGLKMVVANLLSNAIDYTPNGGTVTISAVPQGNNLEISVADTGIGIPSQELPLLFTKLYRGANAKKMRPAGSGLGLFVAKNVLHAHNAEIVIHSKEGRGTQISFSLPMLGRDAAKR